MGRATDDTTTFDGLIVPEFFVNRLFVAQDLGACVRFYFGSSVENVRLDYPVPTFAAVWPRDALEVAMRQIADAVTNRRSAN